MYYITGVSVQKTSATTATVTWGSSSGPACEGNGGVHVIALTDPNSLWDTVYTGTGKGHPDPTPVSPALCGYPGPKNFPAHCQYPDSCPITVN